MTEEALNSLKLLIQAITEQFPNINVLGAHKEWKNNGDKRCPGDYGLSFVQKIRKELKMKSPQESGHGN